MLFRVTALLEYLDLEAFILLLRIVGHDLQQAAGSFQLCAGQMGGCEAAVHVMKQIFDLSVVDGVLLVDAKMRNQGQGIYQ